MIIIGIDPSISGTALVSMELDVHFKIISIDFLAFSNRKTLKINGIVYYDSTEFKNTMLRNDYVAKIIKREIEKENIEYVSIEDYAMSAKGMLFHIGEFVGNIKHTIYTEPNIKLRLYDPNTIKMFATGKGNGTKLDMYNSYLKLEEKKIDLTGFPIPKDKKGVSPTSDIIDAYYICLLLREELKAKTLGLNMVDENSKKILTKTAKIKNIKEKIDKNGKVTKKRLKAIQLPIIEKEFITER